MVIDLIAHLLFTLAAGLVAWKLYGTKGSKSIIVALGAAFVSGILIDLDHLFDYFLAFGFHFDLYTFLYNQQFVVTRKNYVVFHGYEYAALLGISLYWAKKRQIKMILLALLLSMLFHLVVDMMIYSIPVKHYSLIYRILTDFQIHN